jgi:hypothetical protein
MLFATLLLLLSAGVVFGSGWYSEKPTTRQPFAAVFLSVIFSVLSAAVGIDLLATYWGLDINTPSLFGGLVLLVPFAYALFFSWLGSRLCAKKLLRQSH